MSVRGVIKAGKAAVEAFLDDKKLSKDLKGLNNRLRVAGNLAGKVGIAAVTGLAAGAVYKVKQSMSELDEIGKRSAALGIDPKELMSLAYAAQRAGGITREALEKGIVMMMASVGDAIKGTAHGGVDAFSELGLSAQELAKMSAGDQLKAIATGFESIEDPARKASLTMAIFGHRNSDMLKLMVKGGKAIDDLQKKWEKITGLEGPIDTAAVERANDAISDLKLTFDALFTKLTLDNAKDLAVAFEMMSAAAVKMRDDAAGVGGEEDQRWIPWMADIAEIGTAPLRGWKKVLGGAAGDAGKVSGELFAGNFGAAISELAKTPSNRIREVGEVAGGVMAYLRGETKTWGEELEDTADAADNVAAALKAAAETDAGKAAAAAIAAAQAQAEFAESAQKVIDKLKEQVKYFGKTTEEITLLKLAAGEAGDHAGHLAEELERLIAANKKLQDAKEATDVIKKMADAFTEEAQAIGKTAEELRALKAASAIDIAVKAGGSPAEIQRLADALSKLQRSEAAQKIVDDVAALTQKYRELAESIGKSTEELEEMEFQKAKTAGATNEQLNALRRAIEAARGARRKEEADKLKESVRTNKEIMDDELAQAREMLRNKLIDEETFQRRKAQLQQQYGDDRGGGGVQGLMGGSSFQERIAGLSGRSVADNMAVATRELTRRQLIEAGHHTRSLRNIERATQRPLNIPYRR